MSTAGGRKIEFARKIDAAFEIYDDFYGRKELKLGNVDCWEKKVILERSEVEERGEGAREGFLIYL